VAKEAFEPDMYEKLGLAEEFPTEQPEWLKKQGISDYWARKYWIAHWDQPSIGQGFEMLHRGVIDFETLDLLFRAVEIPRFWRDKLTKIAYTPYTRVDVRRMHDMGVLTDEELLRAYMDLGYDPDKAVKMAEFTIRYNAEHDKELTRSTIISSYTSGLIDRDHALQLLMDCDYSHDLADYYLTFADYEEEKDTQDLLFDNIRERYLLNLITETEVRNLLNQMGIKSTKIDAYIARWNLTRYKYEPIPTKDELDNWLLRGVIDESQWRDKMHQRGYSQRDIQCYYESLLQETAVRGRLPTKADLTSWFKAGIITAKEFADEMTRLNYAPRYIRYYLQSLGLKATEAAEII